MFDKGNCCFSSNIIVLYELYGSNWRGVVQVERLFVPRFCWSLSIIYTTDAFYNANARHRPLCDRCQIFSFTPSGRSARSDRVAKKCGTYWYIGLSGPLNPCLADIIWPATHSCFGRGGIWKTNRFLSFFPGKAEMENRSKFEKL